MNPVNGRNEKGVRINVPVADGQGQRINQMTFEGSCQRMEAPKTRRERIMQKSGAPGMTRTCGTQIRNLVLYPPELRGHNNKINYLVAQAS